MYNIAMFTELNMRVVTSQGEGPHQRLLHAAATAVPPDTGP